MDTVWSILYKCLAISEKIKTERENIRYMKRRLTLHCSSSSRIPVYDENGMTVIDEFEITNNVIEDVVY